MTIWEKPLADRLMAGARNVENARRDGITAHLAGWEHQVMEEAVSALRTAKRQAEHPTPTQYAPELVERMVAFVRAAAKTWGPRELGRLPAIDAYEEARSIVSDLPQEVDPDLVKAVQLIDARGINGDDPARHTAIEIAEEGIKLGRQLQRGEAA